MMTTGQPSLANTGQTLLRPCCHAGEEKGASSAYKSLADGTWWRLGASIVIAGQSMVWSLGINLSNTPPHTLPYQVIHSLLILSTVSVMLLLGGPLLKVSWHQLRHAKPGIECLFLISLLGSLGGSFYATFTGEGKVYYEVVAFVLIIYTFGSRLGRRSRERALADIASLRERFDTARVRLPDGTIRDTSVKEVRDDDRIEVIPGGPIPVNGTLVEGHGYIKETPLTGEPLPVLRTPGQKVTAGTWSVDATLLIRPETDGKPRIIESILDQVDEAARREESIHQIRAASWIRYFVLLVASCALITFVLTSVYLHPAEAWLRSMAVLLVACPCALGIATPLAVWTGLCRLSSLGLVSRSTRMIDALAQTRHLLFDKTGTLTEPRMRVESFTIVPHPLGWSESTILLAARALESGIEHPVARAIASFMPQPDQDDADFASFWGEKSRTWVPGSGIESRIALPSGETAVLRIGPPEWAINPPSPLSFAADPTKIPIAFTCQGQALAFFFLSEAPRPGIPLLFDNLRDLGIRVSILSGDPLVRTDAWSGAQVHPGLKPEDKAALVNLSLSRAEAPLFIGDGINDLPAMTRSCASIALQDSAASITLSNADAILREGALPSLDRMILAARDIHRTLQSNLILAASYNLTGITLAAAGFLTPVIAALIMVVSSLTVTFRAARAASRSSFVDLTPIPESKDLPQPDS